MTARRSIACGLGFIALTTALLALGGCSDGPPLQIDDGRTPAERSSNQLFWSCGVYRDEAKCWDVGVNPLNEPPYLMLRDEVDPSPPLPALPLGSSAPVTAVAEALRGTRCAALLGEGVKCWGWNWGHSPDTPYDHYGLGRPDPMLVLGDTVDERGDGLPFVPLGASDVVSVTEQASGYCALFDSGRVKCWGYGRTSLGQGDTETRGDDLAEMGDALPYVDLGDDVHAVGIAGSYGHVCVWTDEGKTKCWGYNYRGQLGLPVGDPIGDDPGEMGNALPFVDLGADFFVVQVSVGIEHTCALSDAGRVKCWGANYTIHSPEPPATVDESYSAFGRLGTGDRADRTAPLGDALAPIDLGGEGGRVVAIASSDTHSCALFQNARLKCWGLGQMGALGYEDWQDVGDEPDEMGDALPFVDLGGRGVVKLTCRNSKTCALLDDDTIACWGVAKDDYQPGNRPDTMGDSLLPIVTAEQLGS